MAACHAATCVPVIRYSRLTDPSPFFTRTNPYFPGLAPFFNLTIIPDAPKGVSPRTLSPKGTSECPPPEPTICLHRHRRSSGLGGELNPESRCGSCPGKHRDMNLCRP